MPNSLMRGPRYGGDTDTNTNASATQTYNVNIPAIVGGTTAYVGFTGGVR